MSGSARRGAGGLVLGASLLALGSGCDALGQMASEEWDSRGKPAVPAASGAPPASATAALPPAPVKAKAAPPGTARPASAAPKEATKQVAPEPLRSAERLTTSTGGCSLVGTSAGKVYGRASDCKHVLELDPSSGKVVSRPLGRAILVRAVDGGAAYGCELGYSDACHLLRAPLDGGKPTFIADYDRVVDGSGQVVDGSIAVRTVLKGTMEGAILRLELATGRVTEIAPKVGVGQVILAPSVVYFEGALDPRENVGSPSWALWSFTGGAAPRALAKVTASGMAADARHVYYVNGRNELVRVAVDGSGEQLLAGIPMAERLEGKLGVSPSVALDGENVYVSTANVEACQVYRVAK